MNCQQPVQLVMLGRSLGLLVEKSVPFLDHHLLAKWKHLDEEGIKLINR
jgi:hypothetical protein